MKFKLMKPAQFNTLLGKIGTTQAVFTADVQAAAIFAIAHSLLHGNVEPASQLYATMGRSVRRDSLLAYLEKHGAMAWSKTEKKLLHFKREDVKFNDAYVEMLEKTPWNEAVRQPEAKSRYDVDEMFTKFLASLRKVQKEAEANPSIRLVNADLIQVLASAEATWFDSKTMRESKADQSIIDAGADADAIAAKRAGLGELKAA